MKADDEPPHATPDDLDQRASDRHPEDRGPFATLDQAVAHVEVIHQDEHVGAIAKPAGVIVHRGWGRDRVVAVSIARRLLGRYVYPVHRLDRETSGALVFGFSPEVAQALQGTFEERAVDKRYLALVRNAPDADEGVVDRPLRKHKHGSPLPARTRWRCLARLRTSALVVAFPETGRVHQVRRHLRDLGHPVIGDQKFGRGYHSSWLSGEIGLERMALHALSIALPHPVSGGALEIVAPVPPDLAAPLARLGADLDAVTTAALSTPSQTGGRHASDAR